MPAAGLELFQLSRIGIAKLLGKQLITVQANLLIVALIASLDEIRINVQYQPQWGYIGGQLLFRMIQETYIWANS